MYAICKKYKSVLFLFRLCNCDIGDDVMRADAGTLQNTADLPVQSFHFHLGSDSIGQLKIGALYCADGAFGRFIYILMA